VPMPDALCTLVHPSLKSSLNRSYSYIYKESDTAEPLPLSHGSRDTSLFTLAKYLRKGGASEAIAQQVLKIMAKNCKPPFNEKEALAKVRSTYQHEIEETKSLAARIREWIQDISVTPGVTFSVTRCDTELGCVTQRDKANRRKILSRLVKDGLIEPYGKTAGEFRIVDKSEEVIDWMNAEDGDGLPCAGLLILKTALRSCRVQWSLLLVKAMPVRPLSCSMLPA
jgi:hypothetical protein